ncbi:MAG: putative bifunctional diguanylate cyclase/phosphodiesterase [Hydrogenovibrio sp.]
MWRKLSIQLQLMILIIAITLVLSASFLGVTFWLDIKERKALAVDLSQSLHQSLSQDLNDVIHQPDPKEFSELEFRLSGFPHLDRLLLLNNDAEPVFDFQASPESYDHLVARSNEKIQFDGDDLFIKQPLIRAQQPNGHAVYIIDIKDFESQFRQHLLYVLLALPFQWLLALLLTWWVSRNYNQPFTQLANAMKRSDVSRNHFERVTSDAQNEIGDLFNGYNEMVTHIETTNQALRYQSEHDPLTGLYNRFFIEKAIQASLNDTRQTHHLLLSLDLDRFNLINEAAGYPAGDELLKMVAHSTLKQLPDNAIMGRLGGDDFYILQTQTTAEEATALAEQLQHLLSDFRFSWENQAYSVSGTLGGVLYQPHEYTQRELIKAANLAFLEAKSAGRNKLHFYQRHENYEQTHQQQVITAGWIKQALKTTTAENEPPAHFELYAQAIVPLQTPTTRLGYEILLRLHDDQGNLVPPDNFLPTAERYQMMTEIDIFVLSTYIETVMQQPQHLEQLDLAHVNLSGASLNHPDFQANLKRLIDTYDFPWHKLELEITETAAVGNFQQARPFIDFFKSHGIGLTLDDFGTGMSSFEYLKSLPFDVVKIDGSFVKDMHTDPTDRAVIRYIQEISALRHQKTVAEYVETQEDVTALTEIGVTYGQGYFLGKPKPLSDWL